MFEKLKKYEKALTIIGGLSFFLLIGLWLVARFANKKLLQDLSAGTKHLADQLEEKVGVGSGSEN